MKRTIIEIDEKLCNGCGICVEGCHEGALQLIDGKAVMVSDLYCDGLGACIGDCPEGAIKLIERESEPYDEIAVMERIHTKGKKVIMAHLKHLKDYNQMEWYNQAVEWCKEKGIELDLPKESRAEEREEQRGESFKQWPIQLHLLNSQAHFLKGADLLLAADCSAFTNGELYAKYLKNRAVAIACPKLDSNLESYLIKLSEMIELSKIDTITILMMEVPCCGGLLRIAQLARDRASRKIPIKRILLSVKGELLGEEWL